MIQAVAHVDCASYFAAVANAIEHASHDIFLSCWFFTPELYLIRDPLPNSAYLTFLLLSIVLILDLQQIPLRLVAAEKSKRRCSCLYYFVGRNKNRRF